ncbi:thioester reductase [Desulfosporosinus sp. HMP52]|uniref:non-ribosomal peptide synthetase family protein n=1 Tax=Desulfosporosinus sp. HMP52 TaxID=1487923 RepID=UPI00051F89B0|nr:non-ribosomal peptide synthetase [Desulfosporosinus sp. HMP52]KGK85078.1 thioester reductase [Desulfosporosinus sp. HMP52]
MKKEINTYPLTSAQKSISIIEKFYPNPSYVNLGITIRFKGQLDYRLLNNAINLVIMQNDALRTRLKNDSNEIVQYFPEYNEHHIELLDFSYNKGLEDYYQWAQDVTKRAFQFYDSDLCYFAMLKFSGNESGLFIKCHHIIVDFWAIILLVNKIANKIANNCNNSVGEVGLEINEPSYVEYIKKEYSYLSSSRFLTDRDYWQQKISTMFDTNLFMRRGSSSLDARRKSYPIPREISSRINELCNQHKISPFILFCSVLSIYFWKKEGREQIVIGSTVLNRTTLKEKNTIGAFFNNLPFIVKLNPALSFNDYLNYLNIEWLTMLRYSSYPYLNILKQFRDTQKYDDDLFDFTLTFLNANLDSGQLGFELEPHFNGQEVNALRVNINDMKSIGLFHLDYDYSIDVLKEAEIEDINRSLLNLVQDGIKYPNKSVGNLNMLSDSEQQLILSMFNQTEMEFQPEKTVIDLVERTVRKIPEKIALVFENNQLTYQELNDRSNKLARFLLKKGVGKEEIVGFSVERSFDLVVGILGILKSGAAYLPIDPSYPRERIEHMLKDSNCRFLLTNCSKHNHLKTEVEVIDLSNSEIWEGITDGLVCTLRPNDLAYLIYTSGSTGTPKGVMIEHRAISNFIHSITREINFTYKTIISTTTLSFDIFFMETLLPLIVGLKVIIASNEELATPSLLSDLIVRYQVDVLQATPARLNIMLNSSTCLNELSLILVGGEVFPQSVLSRLKKVTKAQIYNMYGPTETTIWASTKRLDDADQITIGRPIGNTKFYILDKYQMPVSIGMLGEIFIAGEGVARGYLNRPELTNEKFLPDPFFPGTRMYKTGDLGKWLENGEIEYIGRNDNQVKIRGFRIELSEIEECLLKNQDVKQAVVTTYQHLDRALLCAFLVGSIELPVSELRQHMLGYLPEYMIPNRFIWLPALPLTPNGKVDRKSLPNPNWSEDDKASEYVAPRDHIEQCMADIWSKTLNVTKIGIDDNFFELGGDSLAILEILSSSLSEAWKISVQEFYEHPTIRSISLEIRERGYITHQNKKASVYVNHIPSYFEVLNGFIVQGEVNTGEILLTGATGFLGMHILKELLNNQLVKVYCIVRGADFERRFRDLLYFYFPQAASELNQRVILVNGDITKKRFGLSSDEYQELVGNVTSVIHAAAMVKHYGSYSDFERINVKGTQEIVDFCSENDLHLSFISTTSVSGNYMSEKVYIKDFTENDLYNGQDYKSNVYVRSKFEAESLILEAVKKGLKATIFRVGILTGRISDGRFQRNIEENAFYRKLKSIFTIGLLPNNIVDEFIEFTPVDSCARAIISILQSSSPKPLVFHLYNHKTIKMNNLIKITKNYGINIKCIASKEFLDIINYLAQFEKEKEIVQGIVTEISVKGTLNFAPSIQLNSVMTINFLRNVGFDWPDLTKEYFGKIILNMKSVGFLK